MEKSDNLKENLDRLNELEERLEELYEREEEIRKLEYSLKLATSKLDEAYEELKEEVTPKLENEIKESIKKSTNNKYQNVIYNENDGILVQNYLGDIVTLDKLSIGTIDQAYLGFRMAIAKEVADLPIILDESFAFYDDERLDNILKDIDGRLAYQGLNLAQYLKLINKSEDDMRKEYEAQASESVKTRLVLEAIVKAEKIEATDAEIEEKIKEMAKNYGKKEEELLENENLKEYLKNNITTEKAIQFIVDNAKIKATKKAEKTEKTANTEKSE